MQPKNGKKLGKGAGIYPEGGDESRLGDCLPSPLEVTFLNSFESRRYAARKPRMKVRLHVERMTTKELRPIASSAIFVKVSLALLLMRESLQLGKVSENSGDILSHHSHWAISTEAVGA